MEANLTTEYFGTPENQILFLNIELNDAEFAGTVIGLTLSGILLILILMWGITYIIFQKHMFNKKQAAIASKAIVWTCMGFTACNQTCVKRGWWHEIDDRVYVGAVPLNCMGHFKKLKDIGITGIINTMHEYGGNRKALQTFDIEQLYLPVVDHYAPTLEQTEQGVVFIQRHLDAGGAVLVHCKGGHGRSAAIGFAWLLKSRKNDLRANPKAHTVAP